MCDHAGLNSVFLEAAESPYLESMLGGHKFSLHP